MFKENIPTFKEVVKLYESFHTKDLIHTLRQPSESDMIEMLDIVHEMMEDYTKLDELTANQESLSVINDMAEELHIKYVSTRYEYIKTMAKYRNAASFAFRRENSQNGNTVSHNFSDYMGLFDQAISYLENRQFRRFLALFKSGTVYNKLPLDFFFTKWDENLWERYSKGKSGPITFDPYEWENPGRIPHPTYNSKFFNK